MVGQRSWGEKVHIIAEAQISVLSIKYTSANKGEGRNLSSNKMAQLTSIPTDLKLVRVAPDIKGTVVVLYPEITGIPYLKVLR